MCIFLFNVHRISVLQTYRLTAILNYKYLFWFTTKQPGKPYSVRISIDASIKRSFLIS